MKKLMIAIAFLFTAQANASFYQVSCSSADGTMTSANGHVQNFMKVTKRTYENGKMNEEVIELDTYDVVDVEYSDQTQLENKTIGGCDVNPEATFVSWEKTTVQKVTLTNADGSMFDKDIVGVSADGLKVEAYMLCKEDGNSMIFCQ